MKSERVQSEAEYLRGLKRTDIVAAGIVAFAIFNGLTFDWGGPFMNGFIGVACSARIAADFGYRHDLSQPSGQQGETEV